MSNELFNIFFKVFEGNKDRSTVVSHVLDPPILTRFVVIQPETWYAHISLRVEFFGCREGKHPTFLRVDMFSHAPLNSSHDCFDLVDLGWISELVNFLFYAPKFAEVMVIQNCEFYIVWYAEDILVYHFGTPTQTRTRVYLSICLTLCYFKCLLVSLLKVSRTKILDFN